VNKQNKIEKENERVEENRIYSKQKKYNGIKEKAK